MNENLMSSISTTDDKLDINSGGEDINNNNQNEKIRNKAILNEIIEILKKYKTSKQKEEESLEELINYIKSNNINILEMKDSEKSTIIQNFCSNKEDYYLSCMLLCLEKLYKEEEIIQYMLNEDVSKMNIFETSCEVGEVKIFRKLTKYLKNNPLILKKLINDNNDGKRNIFHIAADKNKIMSLLYFYSFYYNTYGSCLNLKNKSSWTPLHIACYRGHYEFAQYLVNLGVDINCKDSDNKTPLFYAAQSNSIKIVKYLILNGVNKKLKDNKNKTAIEYANDKNIYDILEDKNIFRLAFKCETQYESLKNHHRNILMVLLYIFMTILQIFIIARYKSNNFIQKLYGEKSFSIELTLLIFDIITEILGLCIYIFFKIMKNNKRKISNSNIDHNKFCIKENGIEYYEIFKYNENICVKCQRVKEMNTQHCIACDICIDNFDHHCFFLDSCIYNSNKIYFNIFLFEALTTVFLNLFTSFLFFIDFIKYPRIYYGIIYNESEFDTNGFYDFIIYLLDILYFLLALFFILASIIPFIFDLLAKKKNKVKQSEDNKVNSQLLPLVESNIDKNII